MIDIFDILFSIAFLLSIGCIYVSCRIYQEIPYKGILWLMGSFVFLAINRAITCLKNLEILYFDNDLNSAIGIITISLILAGMFSLLKAIQKYKRTNGNGK